MAGITGIHVLISGNPEYERTGDERANEATFAPRPDLLEEKESRVIIITNEESVLIFHRAMQNFASQRSNFCITGTFAVGVNNSCPITIA